MALALIGLAPEPAGALSESFHGTWTLVDGERLRWEGVHRQETSRTCGPATLVTLLTYYYDFPVSEQEAARRALGLAPEEATPERLAQPASMRGLRDALRSWGLAAYGIKMSPEGLAAYLREQQRPVMVRIVHPEPHFTLLTGIVGDHVLMADSSLGWRALPLEELAALWDGYGLVVEQPLPPAPEPSSPVAAGWRHDAMRHDVMRHDAREAEELRGRLEHLRRGLLW